MGTARATRRGRAANRQARPAGSRRKAPRVRTTATARVASRSLALPPSTGAANRRIAARVVVVVPPVSRASASGRHVLPIGLGHPTGCRLQTPACYRIYTDQKRKREKVWPHTQPSLCPGANGGLLYEVLYELASMLLPLALKFLKPLLCCDIVVRLRNIGITPCTLEIHQIKLSWKETTKVIIWSSRLV